MLPEPQPTPDKSEVFPIRVPEVFCSSENHLSIQAGPLKFLKVTLAIHRPIQFIKNKSVLLVQQKTIEQVISTKNLKYITH